MDYPQFNQLMALAIAVANGVGFSLGFLLSKLRLPRWLVGAAWAGQGLSLLLAVGMGLMLVRLMPSASAWQLAAGVALIGGVAAYATAFLNKVSVPDRVVPILVTLQLLASAAGIFLALALFRTITPLPAPPLP